MAVLRPVKLTITNYPAGQSETFTVENNPNRPEDGTREVTFSRELYIEAEDFLDEPVPKYKRLYPDGPECRLKGAYLINCTGCANDEHGNVAEIARRVRPRQPGRRPRRRPQGEGRHHPLGGRRHRRGRRGAALRQPVLRRRTPTPADKDFLDCLNPNSLEVLTGCKVEAGLAGRRGPRLLPVHASGLLLRGQQGLHARTTWCSTARVSLKDSFKPKK